jgi:uridine kinase
MTHDYDISSTICRDILSKPHSISAPVVVAVCGISGSGKSRLANEYRCIIRDITRGGIIPSIIYGDNFYIEKKTVEEYTFSYPVDKVYSVDTLRNVVAECRYYGASWVCTPYHDFQTANTYIGTVAVVPSEVIVVEGIYTLYAEHIHKFATGGCKLFDVRVLIDIDPYKREQFSIIRDIAERNVSIKVMNERENMRKLAYEKYILPYCSEVNYTVN